MGRGVGRAEGPLHEAVEQMKQALDEQRILQPLHFAQRDVLTSLSNHCEGLTVFLDHPAIPMDNNGLERKMRTPVVGRKNYYGSVTQWSARFTATMLSIFETLALWNINELEWLSDYLRACAVAGGTVPEQIEEHLPWNIRERSEQTGKFSGRWFNESELEMIRLIINESTAKTRTAIARIVS